jgi:hypothetical protein
MRCVIAVRTKLLLLRTLNQPVTKFSNFLDDFVAAINFADIRSVFERCKEGQSFRIFPLTQFLENC